MRTIYYGVIGASLLLLTQALAETAPTALPGLEPFPAAVRQQLERALRAKGDAYTPRTRHLFEDGRPQYTNRLILEPSPYLLQHAHNPVIGTRGEMRPLPAQKKRTNRSSCPSAIRPATGAM